MGKFEKLVKRLKSKPKDLTFAEVETLLGYLGYYKNNKGRLVGREYPLLMNTSQQ